MSVTATWAPSAAKTSAVARPMPLAAPVMRTVEPATDRLVMSSSLENGLALLHEAGDALLVVFRLHEQPDLLDRPGADLARIAIGVAGEPGLQVAHGQRRVGGDAAGEGAGLGQEVV